MGAYKFTLVGFQFLIVIIIWREKYNALPSGFVCNHMDGNQLNWWGSTLQWGNLKHFVIKVQNFKSPQKLANYLARLSTNETEYNKFLKWKYEGFN